MNTNETPSPGSVQRMVRRQPLPSGTPIWGNTMSGAELPGVVVKSLWDDLTYPPHSYLVTLAGFGYSVVRQAHEIEVRALPPTKS